MQAHCELTLQADGPELDATLTLPSGPTRGGLVPLHPASDPSRHQRLFEHLAEALPPRGIAVLRYDRRPPRGGDDVPFALQADDALAALEVLRGQPGLGGAPLGLWGWSQGAWVAPLAAARSPEVAFLVLVSSTGVSPAEQMRHGTAEQLRRAGYGDEELAELAELRGAVEAALRGGDGGQALQSVVDRYANRRWFPLAYVPRTVTTTEWVDMDFDPEPVFAQVHCPVLLFYGETDEWTPIEASIAAWRRASAVAGNGDVRVVRLAGASHEPTIGSEISRQYVETLLDWLDQVLARLERGPTASGRRRASRPRPAR